ncbi:MAG TPA: hypothetical protein VIL74_01105 [Pyrinomonadaceae bacterium]|jgi:hypothetical protein
MKTKLKIFVSKAPLYFLKWELPYFEKEFKLVDEPGEDTVSLAFGPDVLEECASSPALKRAAFLFPFYNYNPYHDLSYREKVLALIENFYDAVFVNPGPINQALSTCGKLFSHPFSVDVDKIRKMKRVRKTVGSLIHVSADSPQKDWERSQKVMQLTGLPYEIFPPRRQPDQKVTFKERVLWRYNKYIVKALKPAEALRKTLGYADHLTTIKKYVEYDGFVHIAAKKPDKLHLDGKYTAALLEAGVTGAIIFWHDTFGLGNDFETIFALSKEPQTAAREILEIKDRIVAEKHSARTSEEISERCHPQKIVRFRRRVIESIL